MPRVCIHLEGQGTDWDYAQYFSGEGSEYALVCLDCRKEPGAIEANLKTVSPARFSEIEREGCRDTDKDGIVGRPGVLDRPTDLHFLHEEIDLASEIRPESADIRPITRSGLADFLILAEDGNLFRVDLRQGMPRSLMNILDSSLPLAPKLVLHASPDGEMAAVVEERGRYGVVDLEAGKPTMRLDRGEYRFKHSDFPVAFFEIDGRLRLVHGSDWNRLDVSDPRTGELLTDRAPTSYRHGEVQPEHYLNYFHGGLAVSPGGDWIDDNGWAWAPLGIVTSWDIRRWLEDNPWESEDGPSKRDLSHRAYFWDGPLCLDR